MEGSKGDALGMHLLLPGPFMKSAAMQALTCVPVT